MSWLGQYGRQYRFPRRVTPKRKWSKGITIGTICILVVIVVSLLGFGHASAAEDPISMYCMSNGSWQNTDYQNVLSVFTNQTVTCSVTVVNTRGQKTNRIAVSGFFTSPTAKFLGWVSGDGFKLASDPVDPNRYQAILDLPNGIGSGGYTYSIQFQIKPMLAWPGIENSWWSPLYFETTASSAGVKKSFLAGIIPFDTSYSTFGDSLGDDSFETYGIRDGKNVSLFKAYMSHPFIVQSEVFGKPMSRDVKLNAVENSCHSDAYLDIGTGSTGLRQANCTRIDVQPDIKPEVAKNLKAYPFIALTAILELNDQQTEGVELRWYVDSKTQELVAQSVKVAWNRGDFVVNEVRIPRGIALEIQTISETMVFWNDRSSWHQAILVPGVEDFPLTSSSHLSYLVVNKEGSMTYYEYPGR